MGLEGYKNKVEKWLGEYFDDKRKIEDSYLIDPMEYSLKIGGKRIRPVLMQCVYNMYRKDDEVLPFAGAMEMIHTYSLIHDDLPAMDNDDLRRGKPTNHKVFGEAMAVLAGDSLLNEAANVLIEECQSLEMRKLRGAKLILNSSGIDGMIKGQIIDMRSENKVIDEKTLLEMHRNKTGKLIVASVVAGGILGGAPDEDIEKLTLLGEKLGVAFQIKDDILDVEGDAKLLGKSQSDAENNKTTFVTMYGIEKCKAYCNEITEECYKILDNIDKQTDELKGMTDFLLARKY